jgi:hypothetical protein
LPLTLDAGPIASPRLFGEIVKRFRAMTPVVEMLNAPLKKTRVDPLLRNQAAVRETTTRTR